MKNSVQFLDFFTFLGPLLEAVQMARIYADSKTFVDKKLKFPPGKIIKNFEKLLNQHDGSLLSVDQIKKVRKDSQITFKINGTTRTKWVNDFLQKFVKFVDELNYFVQWFSIRKLTKIKKKIDF